LTRREKEALLTYVLWTIQDSPFTDAQISC
jgi:hypothetical protein